MVRLLSAAMLLIVALSNAASAQNSIYQATLSEVGQRTKEVSTEQLRVILAENSAVVLDTRPRAEFVGGHIPTAHNVDGPASTAIAAVQSLVNGDKTKPLVLYCNGPFCQASRRLADQLVDAGFTNVRRYQLGMPIWRALGGPTEIELEGVVRVFAADKTAVYFDARSTDEFSKGSIPGAKNVPADTIPSGGVQKAPMPQEDFNTRIILFGRDAPQARALADAFIKRPWHNILYFAGPAESLISAVGKPK